jgi:hypothetical protein
MSDKAKAQMFLAACAEHSLAMCKAHQDACDRENADTEFHKSCMDAHATFAEKCVDMARAVDDSLGKSFGIRGNEIEPLPAGLSTVLPDAPLNRAVPRYGQRSIGETAQVDERFRKIVEVD